MTAGPTGQQAILQGQPFEFTGAPMYYEDLSMAVKKGETDWVALLNYAVKTMHEDGSLTEMSKKWYNGLDLTTSRCCGGRGRTVALTVSGARSVTRGAASSVTMPRRAHLVNR